MNDNDKGFFIEWNRYMHLQKKEHTLIYPGHLKDFLVRFAGILADTCDLEIRLNLIMHLWTLWSLGQITNDEIIPVLNKYDEVRAMRNLRIQQQKEKALNDEKV